MSINDLSPREFDAVVERRNERNAMTKTMKLRREIEQKEAENKLKKDCDLSLESEIDRLLGGAE